MFEFLKTDIILSVVPFTAVNLFFQDFMGIPDEILCNRSFKQIVWLFVISNCPTHNASYLDYVIVACVGRLAQGWLKFKVTRMEGGG